MAELVIDLRRGSNALFLRQTVAVSFGLPLDREFTWDYLRDRICRHDDALIPDSILVLGWASIGRKVPKEMDEFSKILRELKDTRGVKAYVHIAD